MDRRSFMQGVVVAAFLPLPAIAKASVQPAPYLSMAAQPHLAGGNYTFSVWYKSLDGSLLKFTAGEGELPASIEDCGNGWRRVSKTIWDYDGGPISVDLVNPDVTVPPWGAQIEGYQDPKGFYIGQANLFPEGTGRENLLLYSDDAARYTVAKPPRCPAAFRNQHIRKVQQREG